MKKLLFISSRLPYPANSGNKSVMYNYCRILHEKFDYEITVASFLDRDDVIEHKPSFIYNVIELPKLNTLKRILNIIKYTFFKNKYPMQVSLYYNPACQKMIDDLIKHIKPDILLAFMIRVMEYGKNYDKGKKIADFDDLLSLRYERQMSSNLQDINPYGTYLYSLPKIFQKMLSLTFIKRAVLKREIVLLKRYEKDMSHQYDEAIFVAQSEADLMNRVMSFQKALAVPLGIDFEYYGALFGKVEKKKYTIAFLGVMSVAHNETAVKHFAKDILPRILVQIPDAKFIIFGRDVPEQLKIIEDAHVQFAGEVEDLRTTVGACEVFVCPLTFGSGIKTKNLEAMAMGVPVVTTSIGAENIDAKNEEDWLIADDDKTFAEQVVRLMQNRELSNRLKANAYRFVEEHFTWRAAEEAFERILPL